MDASPSTFNSSVYLQNSAELLRITHNDIKSLSGVNHFLLDTQLLYDFTENPMFPAYKNIARTRSRLSESEVRWAGQWGTYPG
jgi:hypothetical protein